MPSTTKAVFLSLMSVFILASIYVCRTSDWSTRSNIAAPTPPSIDNQDRGLNGMIPAVSVSRTPTKQQNPQPDRIDRETNVPWRKLARSTGLSDLKNLKLAPNDMEVRIWELPGLLISKTKCWVFSREDGNWKAFIILEPEFNGKIIRKPLDTPSKDSPKWDSYVINDITPAKIRAVPLEPSPENDGKQIIIEVKFGDNYERNFVNHKEFMTKLFKAIKSEFFHDDETKWSKL